MIPSQICGQLPSIINEKLNGRLASMPQAIAVTQMLSMFAGALPLGGQGPAPSPQFVSLETAPKPSWAGFSNGVHRFYLFSAKHNVEDEPQLRNFPHLSRQQSRPQHLRFHLLRWLLADQHKHLRFHKPHTTSVQWRGELSKRSTIRIRYGTVAELVVLRLKAVLDRQRHSEGSQQGRRPRPRPPRDIEQSSVQMAAER